MADGRHLGFCLYIIFRPSGKLLLPKLVFAQNWVKIGGTAWKLGQFFEIQGGYRPPSWILYRDHFLPHEKVAANQITLRPKFDEDRWTGLEVGAMIRNSR